MTTDDVNNTQEASSPQGVDRATGTTLRCWRCEGRGSYCGGMAVVVAETKEDAVALANAIETYAWSIRYAVAEVVELTNIVPTGAVPVVVAHYEMGE